MKRSLYMLALSAPFMLGASLPPSRPIPQAQSTDLVQVNVLDQFLKDTGIRKQSSSPQRSRSRTASQRGSIPKPPPLASVPLPIEKPTPETQSATKEVAAPEQTPSTTPVPKVEEPPVSTQSQVQKTIAEKPAAPETPKPDDTPQPPAVETVKPPVVEQPATATEPAREAEVPKPLAKPEPDTATTDTSNPAKDNEPVKDEATPADKQAEEGETKKAESPPPPPLVKEDPQELQACLADLKAIGAKFQANDPIDDGNGCGIEHPVDVAEVLPGVDLGGATMRCKTALTMAHWLKDTVQPAMSIAMPGRRIVGLVPGSTYQCRLRNSASTGKISEHARGNAYDVAAFKLDNGERIEMKPRTEDSTLEGAFQRTATAGACLHFTTVLSPGSDEAHEDHLHLDILDRKGGYRYCR
ncbi:extensin family protein [Aliirhizobium smilacinae]|nr:extensin family protein [Rhizobium smilacinae]